MYFKKSQQNAARNLAARTLQRAWRKKKAAPVKTTSQIAKIARAVTLRAAETKSYLTGISNTNQGDNATRVWNLNYNISQGSGSTNVLGEKVHLKSIRIQGQIFSNTSSNTATKVVRMVVFRTKKALSAGSAIDITATDLYRNNGLPGQNHVDLHKVDLLYDSILTLTPQMTNQVVTRPFKINIPINRTEYFDDDNSGYFKNKNYYLAIQHHDGNALAPPTTMYFSYAVNFKDE